MTTMKYGHFLLTSPRATAMWYSPLEQEQRTTSPVYKFVNDDERVIYDVTAENYDHCKATGETPVSFEKAGPKENIFFEPAKTKVGIVTCGGTLPRTLAISSSAASVNQLLRYRYGNKENPWHKIRL
ncbi:MAG: hypothetical protein U5L72_09315 [Bacteroidales bacterium]|nr:hypothetical protein [Bacteroidales bacterium]